MKYFAAILLSVVACLGANRAQAQAEPTATGRVNFSAAATFNVTHANAAPGQCGCFYMYGENGQLYVTNHTGFSFVFDYGRSKVTNVNNQDHDLTLSTYMDGVRYTVHDHGPFSFYGQALIGIGHIDSNYAVDSDKTNLAYAGGGGIDVHLGSRFDLRVVEADYLATHIPNAVNDRQNQIRLTSGLVYHFTRR